MSLDLTGNRWFLKVVKNPLFPAVLQWVTLAAFVYLILAGWNYHDIRGLDVSGPLVYTNVNTLFFWVIWLMGLVILIPFIGRLWCTVCPLGYLNDLLARWGLRRRYPRSLRNLYLAGILLVFYNGLVAFFKVNFYPDYSARLLLAIVVFLVAVGLVFRGRIFCGYLCPIGAMVGIYSRVSPWKLDVKDREVCRTCQSKACYKGEEKWYRLATPLATLSFPLRRPGCQVDLFPPEMVEDPRCVMCTQCIKNCPYDNIRWGTRPFLKGVVSPVVPDRSEAVFLIFLMGATTSIFTRVWPALNLGMAAPARALSAALGLSGTAAQVIHLAWGYMLLPFLFVLGLASLARFLARSSLTPIPTPPREKDRALLSFGLARREELMAAELDGWEGRRLRTDGIGSTFALSFIPLFLSAHAAFALIKVNEKIGYLPGALRDPGGVKLYLSIHKFGMMVVPGELVPLRFIRWPALGMVAAGTVASLWAVSRLADRVYPDQPSYRLWGKVVFSTAVAGLGALLVRLVTTWLF